jgi:hypothetical protein
MNERKLIDEIKRLVNNDVIIGYYNGTTFTDDNGKTYASSYLVTNNSPIGRGFIVPYEGKWLVVVANNNQEVRKNIITSRRKISIEDKPKPTIDYLLVDTNLLSITLYTIRDNKWKKYEVPEKVVSFFGFNYNYYIDSNYVVIKSGFNYNIDSNYVIKGRYELLTVLKDDVFTIYTYPEELPVLKTWRKDVFNTYSAGSFINDYNVFTVQQNRLYRITNLGYFIEALSLEQSINLNIAKCRFNEDEITSCRKELFKVKSPKLDTDIISPEEVKKLRIVSTYIKFQ